MALTQTEPAQQCSAISFAHLANGSSCPYSGSGDHTYLVAPTQYDYYFAQYPDLRTCTVCS